MIVIQVDGVYEIYWTLEWNKNHTKPKVIPLITADSVANNNSNKLTLQQGKQTEKSLAVTWCDFGAMNNVQ